VVRRAWVGGSGYETGLVLLFWSGYQRKGRPEMYLFQEDGVAEHHRMEMLGRRRWRWASWDALRCGGRFGFLCSLLARVVQLTELSILRRRVSRPGCVGGTRFPVRRKCFMVRGGGGRSEMDGLRVRVKPRSPGAAFDHCGQAPALG
jgi:hypothetical protein